MAAQAIPPLAVPDIVPNPDANALAFFQDLGDLLLQLLWDNFGVLTLMVSVYLALNYGGTLIGWVRSGFGKFDDTGQGKLF